VDGTPKSRARAATGRALVSASNNKKGSNNKTSTHQDPSIVSAQHKSLSPKRGGTNESLSPPPKKPDLKVGNRIAIVYVIDRKFVWCGGTLIKYRPEDTKRQVEGGIPGKQFDVWFDPVGVFNSSKYSVFFKDSCYGKDEKDGWILCSNESDVYFNARCKTKPEPKKNVEVSV